ncbi:hypothetical protein ACH4UT_31770 [Streptomyces sp. NPDC020799]|uniref:hypothetical protein n=1 Tax=Streptomyces sp. NPDC020799 TaxID=3365091 RepID=UPI0037B578DF
MTDTVAQAERVMEQGAQADLAAVLQLAAAGRLRCSDKTQRPTAATVRTVSEVLTSGDFYEGEAVRAFAWPLLLQAGGLAQLSSGRLELTIGGRKVGPGPEAVRDLWRRWLGHGVPDELSRVEAVKGQRVVNVLSAPGPRRKAVGAALAGCCPPGEWLAVDHLFVAMRDAGHDPVVVRSGGPCGSCIWKIRSTAASASTVTTTGRCCRAVTPCVCCSSTRPPSVSSTSAAPPGARDDYRNNWGGEELDRLSRYDGLLAVRLNPLGAYATGRADRYLPSPAPTGTAGVRCPVRVLANFDLVAHLAPADALLLDAFATRTADHIWTLSMASLLKAVHTGRSLEELRGFLARSSGLEPQQLLPTVATLLADASSRTGKVRDTGTFRLLLCADEAQAVLIAKDRRLRTLCSMVGERHLAVAPGDLLSFRTALLKLGCVLPVAQS